MQPEMDGAPGLDRSKTLLEENNNTQSLKLSFMFPSYVW